MGNGLVEQLSKIDAKQLAKILWEHAQLDELLYEKCEMLVAAKEEGKLKTLVKKKLAKLSNSSVFYDWRHAESFANEIDNLRDTILNAILPNDAELAAGLFEELIACDGAIIESVDDSNGSVGCVLQEAVNDWRMAWEQIASREVKVLAEKVFKAHMENDYGIRDDIILIFSKALGQEGIEHIEQKLKSQLSVQDDEKYSQSRVRRGLINIAEYKQDMNAYIEHLTESGKYFNSMILDQIVEHFILYNRAEEAIEWLDKYQDSEDRAYSHDRLLLKANQSLGDQEAVKECHWNLFNSFLDIENFNSVLALSDENEQVDYRKAAIKKALSHRDAISAMSFLTKINAFEPAVELFHKKYQGIDGDCYYQLQNLAVSFEENQNYLETILIYRRLAESILERAKSKCYHYAVSYLKKAERLSANVTSWKYDPTSLEFIDQLRQQHGRKYAFWSKYEDESK